MLDKSGTEVERLLDEWDAAAEPAEGRVLCAACGALVTDHHQRTEVGGSHTHTFTNPHEIVYRVVCYHRAPGCRQVGEATEEFSWFPGHTWQVAVCRGCDEHLGWRFRGRDQSTFFALVRDRLRTEC